MEKAYLVQLTNNLYRLTLFFPKKEPLRYKMREIAAEILASLIKIPVLSDLPEIARDPTSSKITRDPPSALTILGDLEVLDGFFEVAKAQNWVASVELLRLQEEYNKIKTEIKEINKKGEYSPRLLEVRSQEQLAKLRFLEKRSKKTKSTAGEQPLDVRPLQVLNARQEKILEVLKDKERIQVWQIKEIFPEVSKRTLRRDFRFLLKQGIIERIGERNKTFYQLPTNCESNRIITNKDRIMS